MVLLTQLVEFHLFLVLSDLCSELVEGVFVHYCD